jgi:hypothetical protein
MLSFRLIGWRFAKHPLVDCVPHLTSMEFIVLASPLLTTPAMPSPDRTGCRAPARFERDELRSRTRSRRVPHEHPSLRNSRVGTTPPQPSSANPIDTATGVATGAAGRGARERARRVCPSRSEHHQRATSANDEAAPAPPSTKTVSYQALPRRQSSEESYRSLRTPVSSPTGTSKWPRCSGPVLGSPALTTRGAAAFIFRAFAPTHADGECRRPRSVAAGLRSRAEEVMVPRRRIAWRRAAKHPPGVHRHHPGKSSSARSASKDLWSP